MLKKKIGWMWEELEKAEEYAIAAHEWKELNPDLAKVLISIAKDELKHYEMLHKECVRMVEEHKRTGKEPEHKMHWDCSREDLIEEHLRVKYYIEQFDRSY